MTTVRLLSLSALLGLTTAELRAQPRPPASCEPYQAALAANPNNLDAAARLGRCTLRDESMIAPGGDSTRLMFRVSWTPALRALRHAVDIDPTYAPAYRPLFRILLSEMRDGCSYETGECRHVAPVLRDGDSVLTPPRLVSDSSFDTYDAVLKEWRERSHANLEEARTLAMRWVNAAPNDRQSHEYLGRSLLRFADYAAAADQLELAASLGTPANERGFFWERMEALVKSNRGVDARRVLDEAASDPARDTSQLPAYTISRLNALLGRNRPPPPMPVDSVARQRAQARFDSLMRNQPPRPAPVRQPTIEELIASGDSSGARRRLAQIESDPWMRVDSRLPQLHESHLQVARYHLALRDTVGAEGWLEKLDQPFESGRFQFAPVMAYGQDRPWVGRLWLLRGDVAAARGRPEEAAAMYRRVIGLWEGGDADVQSVVNDARVRLDALPRRNPR